MGLMHHRGVSWRVVRASLAMLDLALDPISQAANYAAASSPKVKGLAE